MFIPSPNVARAVAAVMQLGFAAGHLLALPSSFRAVSYLGVAHIGLLLATLVGAAMLIGAQGAGVWWYSALVGLVHVIVYLETRLAGLPLFQQGVGQWLAPAELLKVFFGAVLLGLSLWSLAGLPQAPDRLARGDRYATMHRS